MCIKYTVDEFKDISKTNEVEVVVDNDYTAFYLDGDRAEVVGLGEGYNDVLELYTAIFPEAKVRRC